MLKPITSKPITPEAELMFRTLMYLSHDKKGCKKILDGLMKYVIVEKINNHVIFTFQDDSVLIKKNSDLYFYKSKNEDEYKKQIKKGIKYDS